MIRFFWRRHPDLNRRIKVLQTSALPLGYGAGFLFHTHYNTLPIKSQHLNFGTYNNLMKINNLLFLDMRSSIREGSDLTSVRQMREVTSLSTGSVTRLPKRTLFQTGMPVALNKVVIASEPARDTPP